MTTLHQLNGSCQKILRLRGCGLGTFASLLILAVASHTQTFTVLHTFRGPDGSGPYSGLMRDSAGSLYGTTSGGGYSNAGVAFRLTLSGKETAFSFNNTGGAGPLASLVSDGKGNFYGTTRSGGASGVGVVFKIAAPGTETVLYSFQGGTDGAFPYAELVLDAEGNLYGTTSDGGENGVGVVFKVTSNGTQTVLHSFIGPEGAFPMAGLLRDPAGNLYGTTLDGGANGGGALFRLSPNGQVMVLHDFCQPANDCGDGANPDAHLVADRSGNLYGTTSAGGPSRKGVIFRLNRKGQYKVLYAFCSAQNCADGATPYAGVSLDTVGNLYGTTTAGGNSGAGVVFKLDTHGHETVLHGFTGGSDGGVPLGGVVLDSQGNLYGTAFFGGLSDGVVFKITP